jgi:hypothetical protein
VAALFSNCARLATSAAAFLIPMLSTAEYGPRFPFDATRLVNVAHGLLLRNEERD